jgi:hypothetical protein
MVLLSQAMRRAAFTGSTDSVFARIAGRQGGAWAARTVAGAYPAGRPHDPALEQLADLHRRAIITDDEYARLRSRLPG